MMTIPELNKKIPANSTDTRTPFDARLELFLQRITEGYSPEDALIVAFDVQPGTASDRVQSWAREMLAELFARGRANYE